MKVYESDKCLGIAGRAWAAVKEGEIVEVVAMNRHGFFTPWSTEVFLAAGRKRYCPATVAMADRMNRESFLKHRKVSRGYLATLGKVISGIASCGEFIVEDESEENNDQPA